MRDPLRAPDEEPREPPPPPRHWYARGRALRSLYDWTMALAGHRHALPALAVVAFVESSFFPVPPDVLMLPVVLARPKRAFVIAGVCTLASVLGGLLGYLIGALLYDAVGRHIVGFYGLEAEFTAFRESYNAYGAWIVFAAGFTPIPYKVFTIASGVTGLDPLTFLAASALSRGIRFYLEAALMYVFGERIRRFIEARLPILSLVFVVLLFGGFLLVHYVL